MFNGFWQRIVSSFLLGLALVGLPTLSLAEERHLDGVAVIVNDDVVTLSEIENRYQAFLQQATDAGVTQLPAKDLIMDQIVERLILESIQIQEATLRGIVVDDEEITDAVRGFAEQNNLQLDEFREKLEEQGIAYRSFRDDVHRQLVLQEIQFGIVSQRVYINQQDIEDFRNSPFFELMASDQYRVGHILITVEGSSGSETASEAEKKALQIVEQLREGADFATMAINNSSASTALEGGDLGWRYVEEIPSLFTEVVVGMKAGETADPIRNALGFHVIQLLEKRGASNTEAEQSFVRHILIRPTTIKTNQEARDEIDQLRKDILGGADFAELAKEYSEDPVSALAGGELGWTDGRLSDGRPLDPAFVEAMEATDTGKLSEVFESAAGWHVLEIVDRRIEDLSDEAMDQMAYRALHQRHAEEVWQDWLKEIRDEAFVKVIHEPK